MLLVLKNVWPLVLLQGLLLTNAVSFVTINGLVGLSLAENKWMATLPITAYVIGSALSTWPASLFMARRGRRSGFMLGSVLGIVGTAIAAWGSARHSFWLLCLGTLIAGGYNAFGQYYRFTAAELAPRPQDQPRAISYVLAGGILGGFVGPMLSRYSKDLLATPYLGSYLSLSLIALFALVVLSQLKLPPAPPPPSQATLRRPWREVFSDKALVVAVFCAVAGYTLMNLIMSATPVAMQSAQHCYEDITSVIAWHVVGMFLPSFFTGGWISRFGIERILALGGLLMLASSLVALMSEHLSAFYLALVLLGVGWNFLFVGGTTLLTQRHRPEEKARVQGFNDTLVFSAQALTALLSGVVVVNQGWHSLNLWGLPLSLATVVITVWFWRKRGTTG